MNALQYEEIFLATTPLEKIITLLSELDAELSKVFSRRGQVVSDKWNCCLQVTGDCSHIAVLVTNTLNTHPLYLIINFY
jgi:hypothetical protein